MCKLNALLWIMKYRTDISISVNLSNWVLNRFSVFKYLDNSGSLSDTGNAGLGLDPFPIYKRPQFLVTPKSGLWIPAPYGLVQQFLTGGWELYRGAGRFVAVVASSARIFVVLMYQPGRYIGGSHTPQQYSGRITVYLRRSRSFKIGNCKMNESEVGCVYGARLIHQR